MVEIKSAKAIIDSGDYIFDEADIAGTLRSPWKSNIDDKTTKN